MSQQTLDLIQSLVIGFLLLRNLQYRKVVKKNTELILRNAQIALAQGKLISNIIKQQKTLTKQENEETI